MADTWEDDFVLIDETQRASSASPVESPKKSDKKDSPIIEPTVLPAVKQTISSDVYQCPNPEVRVCDGFSQRNIQTQALTGWLSFVLKKHNLSTKPISDLCSAISDTPIIAQVVEVLTGKKVEGLIEVPDSPYDKISNLKTAYDVFREFYPGAEDINMSNIVSNNVRFALDLVWNMAYHSTIRPITYSGLHDRFGLLLWCQDKVSAYPNTPFLHDFTKSFSDGLALAAIVESKYPAVISTRNLSSYSKADNLRKAFDCIEKQFGIPKLLSPLDVTSSNPDEISMILYLSLIFHQYDQM